MKTSIIAARNLALAALLTTLVAGCGDSGATPTTTAKAPPADPATNVGQQTSATDATPDSKATVIDGAGTEPAQSVAIFLDSLRRGDEKAANAVLTAKAREEMAKTAYALQPLGTPEGQYAIGRVGFPYEQKSVALVECTWQEPAVAGEPQLSMDIVCEVHQEVEGWRISGIGVTLTGTEDALVLDFEDAASLQATIDAATGQASPQPNASGPTAGPSTTSNQLGQSPGTAGVQMPALPNLPAADAGPANAPDSRIALPPIGGAPLNR